MTTRNREVFTILILAYALTGSACIEDATCGDGPSEGITGFRVTTVTGSDATDAAIFFCAQRRSNFANDCLRLGEADIDYFGSGETDSFEVTIAIEPNDLRIVLIENGGGAAVGSNDGNDWELDGLVVEAIVSGSRSVQLVEQHDIGESMNPGSIFEPDCTF